MGGHTIPVAETVRQAIVAAVRSDPNVTLLALSRQFGVGRETARKFILRAKARPPSPAERHGHSAGRRTTPEYTAWQMMRDRCENPRNRSFADYGARGIAVCTEWRASFMAFFKAIGPRPSPAHSIDRIDNSRGYEPGNVRWATRMEQNRNKRNVRRMAVDGRVLTVPEWAAVLGISSKTIRTRIALGWSADRIIHEPLHTEKRNRRFAFAR